MPASLQSKLEVMALAHEHYRILRDNADRAEEYLERALERGGKQLDEDWWLDLPEPINCLTLGDLMTGLRALVAELASRVEETKEVASDVAKELGLTDGIGAILYRLVEAQRRESKALAKALAIEAAARTKAEEEWLNRDSTETDDAPILDSMKRLPALKEDQQYELTGKEIVDGKEVPSWEIINTPVGTSKTKEKSNEPKPKPKSVLTLKRRPRV